MAITITDKPRDFTFLYQKLIYMASSTNVANTGFRYVVEVTVGGDTLSFTIPPNPSNRLIFDIRPVIEGYFNTVLVRSTTAAKNIQALGAGDAFLHLYESPASSEYVRQVDVVIKEGWIISGVFTPTATGQATDSTIIARAKFTTLMGSYATDGRYFPYRPEWDGNKVLTDRDVNTNPRGFTYAFQYGLTDASVKIPVRSDSDMGMLTVTLDDGTYLTSNGPVTKAVVTLYEDDGTPNSFTYTLTPAAGRVAHFGCFPGNLNQTTYVGAVQPSAFPDYRFYTVQFKDAGNTLIGPTFVFYPMESYETEADCLTSLPYPRIYWVNSLGAWDSFVFESVYVAKYEFNRKKMRKVVGDYSGTTYDYETEDRGLQDYKVLTDQLITFETGPLSDGEFRLLTNMLMSDDVQVGNGLTNIGINSENTYATLPLVIEDSNYEELVSTTPTLRRFKITCRVAKKLW